MHHSNRTSSSPSSPGAPAAPDTRALVLAGGGAAGNAWEIGLVAGFLSAGIDLTAADLIIGTSAGSTVAAQITGPVRPPELYAAILAEQTGPGPARTQGHPGRRAPGRATRDARTPAMTPGRRPSGQDYMDWSNAIIAAAASAADMRRRMGAAALERQRAAAEARGEGIRADGAAVHAGRSADGAPRNRWREIVAMRLASGDWPQQRVLITAIDAHTGDPVVFDRWSGIDLVDAVAASTSSMEPYPIGERRYLNGGYRRSENADLAAGCGRVLVMSPFSGASRSPAAWGMDLATQLAELRAAGSRVETVFPDAGAGEVFDANALDPSTRPQAARGGYAQGRRLAERLGAFWD